MQPTAGVQLLPLFCHPCTTSAATRIKHRRCLHTRRGMQLDLSKDTTETQASHAHASSRAIAQLKFRSNTKQAVP